MANLAEKHDEEHSAHLADSEISRVLSALQKAGFKRSETGNARPDQAFKPRSLMEIAEAARLQTQASKAVHTADEAIGDTIDNMAADSCDSLTDDIATENTVDDQPDQQQAAGVPENGSQDTGAEKPASEPNASEPQDLQAIDAGAGADAGFDLGTDNGVDPASPTSPFETAQAAYDRGYDDGVSAGREAAESELRATIGAEFEAKFSDKISAFETALIGLAKPRTVDTRDLSASLQAAVVRLAAARAGVAIDQLPKLMVTRIENLADAAGKNVSEGHVFMHPDDCAVIAPIMEARESQFKIEPDPGLYRGDIRIRFDGMDISDIADLRAEWQMSQSLAHENDVEVETSKAKISDVELKTQTEKHLSLDPQDASAKSSMISPSLSDGENEEPLIDYSTDSGDVSSSEAIGLMPLTTTGGDDSSSNALTGDNEDASPSESIGLMPLTTTGGDASSSDALTGDNEDASPSESIDLMPLTSKGEDDSSSDALTGDNEDASPSEAIGLMPLTSKNIEE